MRLTKVAIHNYKSFRSVSFEPDSLAVVIGPNGSGKSNLASALDFLADTYSTGLEFAIAKKGGFENVAFRRVRRTKSAIGFTVEALISGVPARRVMRMYLVDRGSELRSQHILVKHCFFFKASKQSLRTDFAIESETLELATVGDFNAAGAPEQSSMSPLFFCRLEEGKLDISGANETIESRVSDLFRFFVEERRAQEESENELFVRAMFMSIARELGSISVYQFSPQIARAPGAPSPNPKISSYGQNLPSLVDWLRRKQPRKWAQVKAAMRDVVPGLEEITAEFLHSKTLGLFFKEENFGRAWNSEDVSDGTIQALSILCSLVDPRNDVVMIEEPENSLHPWIVKQLSQHIRRLSKDQQLIVTTHSPIVMNLVRPNEVWVVFKENGASNLARLTVLNPELLQEWEAGGDRLFDLLDLGILPQALPVGAA